MTPNIRALRTWYNALKSRRYKQARKYLRTNDGMCCLGVYLHVRKIGKFVRSIDDPDVYLWSDKNNKHDSQTGTSQTGMTDTEWNRLGIPELQITYQHMNDAKLWSFHKIAAHIKQLYLDPYDKAHKKVKHADRKR